MINAGKQVLMTTITSFESVFYQIFILFADRFKMAGQNIQVTAAWSNSRTFPETNEAIKQAVDFWFKEYKDADMSDIRGIHRLENK